MGLLVEVAIDAARALQAVESDPELMAGDQVAEAAMVLRGIIGQEFDLDEDQVRGRVVAAGFGRSSPRMTRRCATVARPRRGSSLVRSCTRPLRPTVPILTAIALSAGNEHDGHHAGALIEQQPEDRRPERVIGDTAFGNVEARELLEQRQVSVLAPVHSSSPRTGRSPKTSSRSIWKVTLSPARRVTPPRSTSPEPTGGPPPASGSHGSPARTASPARSGPGARPTRNAISGSDAARTYAKPHNER
jgi:hypothetical protein